MAALRYNTGKPQLSFLLGFGKALGALARVFEQGAIKYERDNWQKGGKPNAEYIDSALRHLVSIGLGETYDRDTGCLHAAHVMWNMGALIELNHKGGDLDPGFDQAAFEERYSEVSKPVIPAGPPTYTDSKGTVWTDGLIDAAANKAVQAGARAKNVVDL